MGTRVLTGADRQNSFGGSDIPAVVELSPYVTREEVIRRKAGLLPDVEQTWPMRWGHLCEPTILQELHEDYGWSIERNSVTFQHSAIAWATATPDARVNRADGNFLIQCKAAMRKRDELWGANGSGDVPAHVVAQVLWEMSVMNSLGLGVNKAIVAVRFGTRQVQTFPIPYDAERANWLHEKAAQAWLEVEQLKKENAT